MIDLHRDCANLRHCQLVQTTDHCGLVHMQREGSQLIGLSVRVGHDNAIHLNNVE